MAREEWTVALSVRHFKNLKYIALRKSAFDGQCNRDLKEVEWSGYIKGIGSCGIRTYIV